MTVKEIDAQIAELKLELGSVKGTQTEVYTRIVGYYRSVRNWNAGKRSEYKERKLYDVSVSLDASCAERATPRAAQASAQAECAPEAGGSSPEKYLLFTRKTCPNCPPVTEYVKDISLAGSRIDVDTEEGLAAARKYGVMASPTVIFLDREEREVARANNVQDLKKIDLPRLVGAHA
jgi:ribonucleoside-triphosphate reductase